MQASNFLNTVGQLSDTDLPLIIDIEGGGINKDQSMDSIHSFLISFLNIIEENIGRKPIIYTNISTGNKYLNSQEFSDYPLWIADYSDGDNPTLPKSWQGQKWLLWQKSSDYIVDSKKNDFDVYNGNIESLKEFIAQH